ncbi:MAG: rRNA maturation RNase YbeY [Alphaproteobacteria bacterium]|nr:rRNA maturation RNase YbeY [Alphaproteobacteria bacterium]
MDARTLLGLVGLPRTELSVMLCDDATIAPLNEAWRGRDAPTDVLSFPQEEAERPGVFATPPMVLGDIVISTETAARQADEHGHDLETEVRVLLAHGLLHLVGHDHEDDEVLAAGMREEERRLLDALGIDAEAALIHRAS